jgi:hypothetical protein
VQLALAAAVGLLLAGGGAFAWWQDRQANARREQLTRNADALAELVSQCEVALQKNDADRAAAALEQIDRRLPEGGGDAIRDRADRCRTDLALLRELDDIDTLLWTPAENRLPDPMTVVTRWQAALAGYGVVPEDVRRTTRPKGCADRSSGTVCWPYSTCGWSVIRLRVCGRSCERPTRIHTETPPGTRWPPGTA